MRGLFKNRKQKKEKKNDENLLSQPRGLVEN